VHVHTWGKPVPAMKTITTTALGRQRAGPKQAPGTPRKIRIQRRGMRASAATTDPVGAGELSCRSRAADDEGTVGDVHGRGRLAGLVTTTSAGWQQTATGATFTPHAKMNCTTDRPGLVA
jgi:hypothetical protein